MSPNWNAAIATAGLLLALAGFIRDVVSVGSGARRSWTSTKYFGIPVLVLSVSAVAVSWFVAEEQDRTTRGIQRDVEALRAAHALVAESIERLVVAHPKEERVRALAEESRRLTVSLGNLDFAINTRATLPASEIERVRRDIEGLNKKLVERERGARSVGSPTARGPEVPGVSSAPPPLETGGSPAGESSKHSNPKTDASGSRQPADRDPSDARPRLVLPKTPPTLPSISAAPETKADLPTAVTIKSPSNNDIVSGDAVVVSGTTWTTHGSLVVHAALVPSPPGTLATFEATIRRDGTWVARVQLDAGAQRGTYILFARHRIENEESLMSEAITLHFVP